MKDVVIWASQMPPGSIFLPASLPPLSHTIHLCAENRKLFTLLFVFEHADLFG